MPTFDRQHSTTTTFIYTKKEIKKNTLILKLTNVVFAAYNNWLKKEGVTAVSIKTITERERLFFFLL